MGLIWRVGVMVGMTVACLVLCAVAETEAPQYKCYSFMQTSSGTKRSLDKRESRQLVKRSVRCPGPDCAAIYPDGDIIREVGTPYKAYCLFDPNLVDVKQVRFMHWGLKPEDQYQIPHTIVNDSAIMVNITHETAEEYALKCEGDDNNLFLCQRSVKVGYLPQDVQNFSCVSKNWEQLNCSWTVPKNPVGVTHMLAYDVPGFKHKSECPKSQTGQSWCYWPENEFTVYNEWVMTFNATNKLMEEGVQFSHKVNVYEIVLPNPVDNLVAYVNGPYNVTLSWMLPYTMKAFPGGVIHEVSYRARRDGDSAEDVPWVLYERYLENARGAKSNIFNKTINNLHAYVHYNFRVRIHTGSGSLQSHLWSEAEVCFATTNATRPTRAPLTDIGTFEVEETQSLRDIFVSWQTIDPMYRNGPEFHYEVTAYENGSDIPLVKSYHEVEIKSAYAKFLNMKKDVRYRFEIKPVNSEGPPSDENIKAIVDVPKKSDLLLPLNYFKVIAYSSSNKTMYSMRWKFTESHQKNENIETITLYWCKRDKYEERCENKLQWLTLDDPNVDSKNLTELEDSFLYIFGISVNSRTSSSGIKWITCVADHGNRPAPIQDFSASPMSPTSVKLTWDLDCRAKAAEPIGFNISYCRVTNNVSNCPQGAEMFYERIMDESATQRVITELHPYSYYIFNIAIMTQIGLSKWSNSQALRTFEDKPSGPPLNLVVVHRGQDALTLSWAMPALEHRNGRIRKYVVSSPLYQFNRIDVDAINSTFPNSEITTVTINGLDPYTNYSVNVVACTKSSHSSDCGTEFATITTRTKIGVPGKIDIIDQVGSVLKWENEECNGPKCSFEIKYRINGTNHFYTTPAEKSAINLRDLNITCESHHKINISMRAFSHNEEGVVLQGPWKMDQITCPAAGPAWWIFLIVAVACIIIAVVLFFLCNYSVDWYQRYQKDKGTIPRMPGGLDEQPLDPELKKPWYEAGLHLIPDSFSPEKRMPTPEVDPIISEMKRPNRNPSGDSGTSEADLGDSSGCSTGGDSDTSSRSDRVHQSSDSGTVQEEPGFHNDNKRWPGEGSLRFRPAGPSYVREGRKDKISGMEYVSVGSVPNLASGSLDCDTSLKQSLSMLTEMPQEPRRTSTGYITMPDTECSLEMLSKSCLPHGGRQDGFPTYSRHNFPTKKSATLDLSTYTKTGSLPWLNAGYVAVAQAEGDAGVVVPQTCGYVAAGEAMGIMKRQPSLPSLPMDLNKSIATPDEELPPGAYCRVGARGSPGPPPSSSPGYVSISQAMPQHISPHPLSMASPVNKSPYVTCAMVENLGSPTREPEKRGGGYVSVGDMADGRWAQPIMPPSFREDGREVASAPVDCSRGRPPVPLRPTTCEATVNRNNQGENRIPPITPSLSKQSSGYVSLEPLTVHDPVVMSPKRLLSQNNEPHLMMNPPSQKGSMV